MSERQDPMLPPVYRAARAETTGEGPRMALRRRAADAPEGTLLWSEARGRLALALLLVPDGSLEASAPVAIAAALALGDAIGALAPPIVAVTNAWPDRIEVNGALAGGVSLDAVGDDPDAPERLILGLEVAVLSGPGREPGEAPEMTSLLDEGCGEIEPVRLLESVSRHFLAWLHRWEEDGFKPLRSAWLARAPRPGAPVSAALGSGRVDGRFRELGPTGDLVLDIEGSERRLSLARALAAGPTWSLT